MGKQERENYKRKILFHRMLGAEAFQNVVFGVEKLKFKIIKTFFPNFIKYYDKFCDYKKKKALKKTKTPEEKKKIEDSIKLSKMAMRKELYQEKNRNYHMDSNRPTEIYHYLKWNKQIHKNGLIKDVIVISLLIGGVAIGLSGMIPLLVLELISAGINFECINIQDYNMCRYKIAEEYLKRKEKRIVQTNIEKFGEASEVIHKSIEQSENLPTIDEIIRNVENPEQLRQLREMLLREKERRNNNNSNINENIRGNGK